MKPDFTLNDTASEPFDFRTETEGFVTLLFFGYTYCPDVCPIHMANIGAVLATLPPGIANQVKVVMVSTDPNRDTRG
jgi:protein SCO1/2